MRTISELSAQLRATLSRLGRTQADLREAAGVSQRTLTNVLSGQEDYRVSTLLALADRLGLEVVLVPKVAATAVQAGQTTAPKIASFVTRVLDPQSQSNRAWLVDGDRFSAARFQTTARTFGQAAREGASAQPTAPAVGPKQGAAKEQRVSPGAKTKR